MACKHEWVCDKCGESVLFQQPEYHQDDYRSEQNRDKTCPVCGDEMYFEDALEVGLLVVPSEGDCDDVEDEEDG